MLPGVKYMSNKRTGDLREDNDFKQDTIANFLNVNRSTYSKYENGKLEIPTIALIQLAKFYNTST